MSAVQGAAECIFCRIARGEIPSKKVYEDEDLFAFHDVRPQAPVHFLIIPREHVASLYDAGVAQQRALGKMLALAGELARKEGATEGFRTIINTGRVGHQEVYHLHMHVLGGPDPLGPMLARRK
jgi:histidine triad (HIT) family protein